MLLFVEGSHSPAACLLCANPSRRFRLNKLGVEFKTKPTLTELVLLVAFEEIVREGKILIGGERSARSGGRVLPGTAQEGFAKFLAAG